MCLIILANDLKSLSYDDMKTAYERNSDGFGVMYMNKENKFVSDKFLPKNFEEVKNFFNVHKSQTDKMAIHFRFTTQGKTNKKNCHPFISYKSDDRTIGMMHNGARLPIPLIHKNCSDTWHFNQHYLKSVLANNPNAILKSKYQNELANHIDDDKMIFLDSKSEKFIIINEESGNYKGANWYSNSYWNFKSSYSKLDWNEDNWSLNTYGFRGHSSIDKPVVSSSNEMGFLSDDEISRTPNHQLFDFVDDCYYSEDMSPIYDLVKRYKNKVI